jgi:signal transduction histidine kinase
MVNRSPAHRLVIQACLVATLSYLAARLGGALIVRPQMVSPLWLGNVLLASVLLLVRRRIWPVVLTAGLAGFFLYDLQTGGPIRSIVWLLLSNAVEVLTAALCLSISFEGMPRLNSVKALAKYSFYAVFLAPFVGAFLGALSTSSNYWASWKVAFFSEALGFLTLMPAILGWAREIPAWAQKPSAYYLEATALLTALVILGHLAFAAPGRNSPPALLYSLVPLLLWSTLRFGSTGVSTAMIAIAFVSIWDAVHGRGPFTEPGPHINVLSLQLFLFFTAAPFMALAALVEERTQGEQVLRQREAELKEAQRLAKVGSWQWAPDTDVVTWSEELYRIASLDPGLPPVNNKEHAKLYTAESWQRLRRALEEALRTGTPYELDLEMVPFDGTTRWVIARGEAQRDTAGRVVRLLGTIQNITERRLAQEKLRESEEWLRLAIQAGRMYAFEWDAATDVIVRSGQCVDILDWMDDPTRDTGRKFLARVHPDDREAYAAPESGPTPENPTYQTSYRVLRPDGRAIWLEANGRVLFDDQGRMLRIIGLVADVTNRKVAEEALSNVSRRMIEAQEQERTRIARELHDDIGQRLALLTIELERLQENPPNLSPEVRGRIGKLREQTSEIATDIQALSHELHSSKLDYLGIAAAVRGFCKDFGKQQKMEIVCKTCDLPRPLPRDISLCLFRVLQEALNNSAKHSGAQQCVVQLWATSEEIHLRVSDSGAGFDSEAAKRSRGLGLISMEERLKLLNGTLSIASQLKRGTTIHARVPLNSGSDVMRAAG